MTQTKIQFRRVFNQKSSLRLEKREEILYINRDTQLITVGQSAKIFEKDKHYTDIVMYPHGAMTVEGDFNAIASVLEDAISQVNL